MLILNIICYYLGMDWLQLDCCHLLIKTITISNITIKTSYNKVQDNHYRGCLQSFQRQIKHHNQPSTGAINIASSGLLLTTNKFIQTKPQTATDQESRNGLDHKLSESEQLDTMVICIHYFMAIVWGRNGHYDWGSGGRGREGRDMPSWVKSRKMLADTMFHHNRNSENVHHTRYFSPPLKMVSQK